MTTCPDCAGRVDTALLHDPEGRADPVVIWDCARCQRSGFVVVGPVVPEPRPAPAPRPAWPTEPEPQHLDPGLFPGSQPPAPRPPARVPAGAGEYPPRRRR